MGLKNQFHILLFNLIAYCYQWFFYSQYRNYLKRLKNNIQKLAIKSDARILDIGCGTGAFGKAFQDHGFQVIGVDAALRMVQMTIKNGLNAFHQDILEGLEFDQNKFDLVIMANVAHGFHPKDRITLYKEALRVSKGKVLIHDYNNTESLFVNLIEYLENGYYHQFKSQVPNDFYLVFDTVQILDRVGSNSWYFCKKRKKLKQHEDK